MDANKIKPILCVVTNVAINANTTVATGFWLSELLHPVNEFRKSGIKFQIVSISGGTAPIDPKSMDLKDPVNAELYNDAEIQKQLKNTPSIDSINSADYSAVFFAGGHGPMWDFPNNQSVHKVVREIYESGGIVSAVCHGPCALFNVQLSNNEYLVRGKKLVSFTNNEEIENGTTNIVPFLLETELTNHKAEFLGMQNWATNVVIDGKLITGQNPQSARLLGSEVSKALLK